ncbi:unnamed protein product [Mesocestoides corti]|uniref:Gag-pol polyprotein n=1 Tax=Mesocestoides corti TaxID=53468 RepID=A0A0R3UK58_MESCO|nr:unnamed protein product [Mesocestoides corti]
MHTTVLTNGHPVRLKQGRASDATVISENQWRSLGRPPLGATSETANSAYGGEIHIRGQMRCCLSFCGTAFTGTFYAVDANLNLLGLDWFKQLSLVDILISRICNALHLSKTSCENTSDIINQFTMVFQPGLGQFSAIQATLHLMPEAIPVFFPKRLVLYASLPLVEAEFGHLKHVAATGRYPDPENI